MYDSSYNMLAPTTTHLTIQTAYPLSVGTTTLVNKTSSDKQGFRFPGLVFAGAKSSKFCGTVFSR